MPNDLSARLRAAYIPPDENGDDGFILSRLFPGHLITAADLIDAQAKEIERLRATMTSIAAIECCCSVEGECWREATAGAPQDMDDSCAWAHVVFSARKALEHPHD